MKRVHLIASFAVMTLSVCFSFAYADQHQGGTGGSGGDTSSAGYQAKSAAADPGVGTSESSNYLYDHGTLWFEDESVEVSSAPSPSTGGGSGGSSGGGSSGSGWITSLFGGDPQIGGVSPEADVPFTDTPEVAAVVAEIPTAAFSAVKEADASSVVLRTLENPQYKPQIIRLVDEKGVTRELNIVLFKRIMPWPLWVALAIIIFGALAIIGFVIMRGAKDYLLWVGGVLILIGVITGIIIRFAYRAVPIDPRAITSIEVVPVSDAEATVRRFMADLPLGVHVIEATDSLGKKTLTVKVFITPALPI